MARDSEHPEHTDGIGNNRLMTGTSHAITLGTAALLMMGLTSRVAGTTPAAMAHLGNGAPEVLRLQAQSKPTRSGYIEHHIEIPMTAEIASERQYDARTLTDEMAHEHGYLTAKEWLTELGIKPGKSEIIYSYPVALTPAAELPHDRDRNGSRLNDMTDRVFHAWSTSTDASIHRAQRFFAELPAPAQVHGFERIAPYRALSDEARAQWLSNKGRKLAADGAAPSELHGHQLPSAVRAHRIFEPHPDDGARAPQKPRKVRNQKKLTEGDGWSVQYARQARSAEQERTPSTEQRTKKRVAKPGKRAPADNTKRHSTIRHGKHPHSIQPPVEISEEELNHWKQWVTDPTIQKAGDVTPPDIPFDPEHDIGLDSTYWSRKEKERKAAPIRGSIDR